MRASGERRRPWKTPQSCFACQSRDRSEWCHLDGEDLALLNRAKVTSVYEPGQHIYHEGSPCTGIFCIEDGTVALRKRGRDGQQVITHLFHSGSTLGYVAYFGSRPYGATAEALTRSRVCFIRRETLRTLLQRNPTLGLCFMGSLANRVAEEQDAKVEALLHPLRARIAHLLLILKDRFGSVDESGTMRIDMPLSRQDIASLVGARPESVSRVLKQLELDGIATFDGRHVTVPDLDPLMDAAELIAES
jgi:CRP/FNR family transcriptional regulator